tara:strand:+ start:1059 stop:1511 length:453 start_codon:yes stop_codon:yes gene_type:complete
MRFIRDISYRKILSLFWQQNGNPLFNAKGIAVGVFSGCFPFFGFQTLLGVFIAKIIKGNLVLAALGTWISNPITYVPLYFLNYKIGSFLLQNEDKLKIDAETFKFDIWSSGLQYIVRILIGSTLVGLISGAFIGLLTYYLYSIQIKRNDF